MIISPKAMNPKPVVVIFKILSSARIVCNIVCVQVRGRIHRELHIENNFYLN
jgi:hypothetical protein